MSGFCTFKRMCVQQQECNSQLCPVDCALSDWSTWDSCMPYCRGTTKRPSRLSLASHAQESHAAPRRTERRSSLWKDFPGEELQQRVRGLRLGVETQTTLMDNLFDIVIYVLNQSSYIFMRSWLQGEWENFTEWEDCSSSCGGGKQKRRRGVQARKKWNSLG